MSFPEAPVDWAFGPWCRPQGGTTGPVWPWTIYLPCARPPAGWRADPLVGANAGGLTMSEEQRALQRPCYLVPVRNEVGAVSRVILLWENERPNALTRRLSWPQPHRARVCGRPAHPRPQVRGGGTRGVLPRIPRGRRAVQLGLLLRAAAAARVKAGCVAGHDGCYQNHDGCYQDLQR